MIEYKRATIEEVDELVQMRLEFLKEVQTAEAANGEAELFCNLKEYYLENMKEDRIISWVATDKGEFVGTSGIYFYCLPPSFKNLTGNVAYIMNMYTKPSFRGKGIAPTLFGKLIDEAKERGCSKISLHATDMGKSVYQKFGFTITDTEMILKL